MLVIIGVLLIFGLVVRHKWRNGAAKKEAILRLVAVASEEEVEIAKLQAIEYYKSQVQECNSQQKEYNSQHNNAPLEAQQYCAVCRCPTTTRCSRCKVVRYCSGKCQIVHWRQGHRDECQPAHTLHARKKSECVAETIPENQFNMHLKDESKICSDPSEECDDTGSSGSSTSSLFSSTDQSETSPDENVESLPAPALHDRINGACVVETAVENLFASHLRAETKTCSAPSEECDDSRSSGGSTFCLLSERCEATNDASINEDAELGTHMGLDEAPSLGIDSHISETISSLDDADVPSTSRPFYSVNPPLVKKIENTAATKIDEHLKPASLKDNRRAGGVAAAEELVPAEDEMRSAQSACSTSTSPTEDLENRVQTNISRETRTKFSKTSANSQMQNMELSSEDSKSSKLPQSLGCRMNEICHDQKARVVTSSMSSGNCQKPQSNYSSPQVVSLDTEGVRILSQSTSKGLKTSVQKLAQHFRAPKQSKPYTLDMVKDSSDNHNHDHKVSFSIKLFMQLYLRGNVGFHPFGLVNCGNSCYANAVLQCLTFTRPITSFLLQGLHSKTCRRRDKCFMCKFEHMIRKGQETNSPLSPIGLLSHIQPIGREEDAHEFLRNVVDKMQSTCLEEAGVSGTSTEESTFIGLTFGGYLRSKIKCMKCLGRSERYEWMLDLTVEIDGDIYTLEQALAQFTMSETLGGNDKYKCNRCKSYEKAKKKLTVLEAPNVLTIVLKRFRSGNLEKLSKQIKFPEALNLSSYMSGMVDKCPIYNLYAVVVHLAVMNGAYSGHYVSYVKNHQGQWFRIDDSRVSRVDLETVLSAEAYILFYARHTPRGASSVRNMYSDGKCKRNTDNISSSNISKKKTQKAKLSSSNRNASHWMSPNDFTGVDVVDPEDGEFHPKHKNHMVDSSSDNSSIFSASDAGSHTSNTTDSTRDSSAEDLSGYLFGPNTNWYQP